MRTVTHISEPEGDIAERQKLQLCRYPFLDGKEGFLWELKIYEHKAQYYETDQMGIIHHANYLHWFEEARIDMMEQMGMGYDIMEKQGIISPVLSVHCDYKSMARFGETVQVLVQMKEYNGIRMTLEYTVFDKETGAIRCVGESRHCFLTRDGKAGFPETQLYRDGSCV